MSRITLWSSPVALLAGAGAMGSLLLVGEARQGAEVAEVAAGTATHVAAEAAAAPAPGTPGVVAEMQGLPPGVTAAMVEQGKEIFADAGLCFACHGDAGQGTPMGPNLTDADWLHIDGSYDALVKVITEGVPVPSEFPMMMAPKGGSSIDDDQVRAVAAYVWTISRSSDG